VILHHLTFAPYELRFRHPLHTARKVLHLRRGFIIALHSNSGVAVGEVAPLPEFGTETLDEARGELERLTDVFEKRNVTPPYPPAEAEGYARFPATRFGIESAMMVLGGKTQDEGQRQSILVNALIGGETVEDAVEAGRKAVESGYGTLKVKVGTRRIRSDIEIFRVLRREFPQIILRADANGAWPFDEARQFAHGVTACALQYIEDPLADPDTESLTIFRRNCEVPLACDEMARSPEDVAEVIEHRLCDVLVLKPAVIGSPRVLKELSVRAKAAGIAVVITSLLESSIGLSYVAHAAAECGTPELAHGLGTAELLENDTVTRPLRPVRGMLTLPDLASLQDGLAPEMATQLGIGL